MKKYILTESQVKLIMEGLSESNNEIKNFDDFLTNAHAEIHGSMASRANKDVDDAMKNYLGHHYQYKYSLESDDLVELNKLSVIVLSILFYLMKEGKIERFRIPDINVNLGKNYEYLKKNSGPELGDLKPLLSRNFKLDVSVDDSFKQDGLVKIVSNDESIETIVEKDTKKVKTITYNFLTGRSLDVFLNVLNKPGNYKSIKSAIGFGVRPDISGKSLTFKF